MMDTIDRILNLIKEKNLTEKQFLIDLGFDKTALSQWKKKQNMSYKKYIYEIADYFSVSTDYLLCITDDPIPPDKKKASSEIEDAENRMIYDELKSVGIDLAVISDEEYERLLLFIDRNRDLILEHTRLNDKN